MLTAGARAISLQPAASHTHGRPTGLDTTMPLWAGTDIAFSLPAFFAQQFCVQAFYLPASELTAVARAASIETLGDLLAKSA